MLLQAAEDFHIDLNRSWMIGDGENDVLAGKNAGCQTALIQTDTDAACGADVKVENLLEFVDRVLLRG
jgi:D-glycero-D-manno-heptose 1,7-bisphosphate phosphatase